MHCAYDDMVERWYRRAKAEKLEYKQKKKFEKKFMKKVWKNSLKKKVWKKKFEKKVLKKVWEKKFLKKVWKKKSEKCEHPLNTSVHWWKKEVGILTCSPTSETSSEGGGGVS